MTDDAGAPLAARSPQTLLGFDYGEARVGVAAGNTLSGSAEALEIIHYRSRADLFGRIGELIAQWAPALLVVGRPLSEQGEPVPVTALTDRFANRLYGRFGLPVVRIDERYSSLAAQAEMRAHEAPGAGAGPALARGARDGGHDDAVAAAVILRQYLHEQ